MGTTIMDDPNNGSSDTNSGGERRMSRGRMAAWAAAALFLLAKLVATQVTETVNWSAGDFVFAGVLLFGSLGAYELIVRMTGNTAYRAGVGVAIVAAFLLVWANAAVGITDSDADLMYLCVPAVGIVGAFVARLRPAGMARAMFAAALATALVSGVAVGTTAQASAFEVFGITGFFAALFAGSALLFQAAAQDASTQEASAQDAA